MELTKSAATRPSTFTIDHFMAYLTRSLITKTGEAPSTVNRMVRKLYHIAKPFDVDFPGHLEELITRIDCLERDHPTAWYVAQARKEILTLRHELEKATLQAAYPQPAGKGTPQPFGAVLEKLVSIA